MIDYIREQFPVTLEHIYMDTAFLGTSPSPVVRAGLEYLERRSRGRTGRIDDWLDGAARVRRLVAGLIGAGEDEIAFTTNTTEGTNIVADCLKLEPGDNVVWDELDHSTNRLVWQHQAKTTGVEMRVAPSAHGAADLAAFGRLVDKRTRVISVSFVSCKSGFVHDLKRLSELAHSHGAYLLVDGIQGVGALTLDVKAAGIDFLTCGAYKWLLGPQGVAFLYVREGLLPRLDPPRQGWMQFEASYDCKGGLVAELYRSARRFEIGALSFQGIYELGAALDYINTIGMAVIEQRVLSLSGRLWEGLAKLGLHLVTPIKATSGIVACEAGTGQDMERVLLEGNIVATADKNRARFATHFFNTEEEVDQVLAVLRSGLG